MFKKISKKIGMLIIASGFLLGAAPAANAQFIPADIVYVVDYSGSMGPDINQVINNIGDFQTALSAAGIDAQYGAVQFGQSSNSGNPNLLTDLTNAAGVSTALSNALPVTGGREPGATATLFALNNITWRAGAVKNIILITDEDDDSPAADKAAVNGALQSANALYNVIIDTNFGSSVADYGTLANNNGGQVFNINAFRADPAAFLANFNKTKVEEIINQAPEPSIMAMLGIGLAGIGFVSRRRAAV